jgi:hypothetical protein
MAMGQREYARYRKAKGLRGGTVRAVQKALASGRIVAGADGRIDADAADAAWAANTDVALQRGPSPAGVATPPEVLPIFEGVVETAPSTLSRRPEWDVPFPPMPERAAVNANASTETALASVVDLGLYQRSKAEREYAEAQMALDKLAESRKELLPAGDVQKAFAQMGKMYAQGRESVPTQLAPQLVGLTDLAEIERRVRKAFREADQRIANEIRSQYAEVVDGRTVVAC